VHPIIGLRHCLDHNENDWDRGRALDHVLCGQSDQRNHRYKQHAELDDKRGNDDFYFSGYVQFDCGDRINECQSSDDDRLYADSGQCHRFSNFHGNSHRNCGVRQADDHFVQRQPLEHQFRFQQYAQLGDNGSGQYRDHAGNIHFYISERFDTSEPDSDDYLYAHSDQYFRLNHVNGNSKHRITGRSISDINDGMSWRHAGRFLHRLHHIRHRRQSALRFFRRHERRLSAIAGGDGPRCVNWSDNQLADWRSGQLQPPTRRD
jgi:hypothetical protein